MKLKDFEELGQLGLGSSSTVEFYNMKNFKEDILTDKFSNLYLIGSEVEDKTYAPFGLLVGGTSLVVFFE